MPEPDLGIPLVIPDLKRAIRGRVLEVRGDNLIIVSRNDDTVTLRLSVEALLPFIPNTSSGGSAPDDTLFMVHLDQTGGSDGSKITAPTYTYTVSKWVSSTTGGSTLATGASPLAPRINGSFSAAINGYAFYHSGTLVLAEALEAPATDECPTAP